MAKRNSNVVALKQPGTKRVDLASEASGQLETLLRSLVKQMAPDDEDGEARHIEPAILKAIALRASALNDVMFAVIVRDDCALTEDLARELAPWGKRG